MSEQLTPLVAGLKATINIASAQVMVLRAAIDEPVVTSFGRLTDRPAIFLVLTDRDGNQGIGEVWCNFPSCGAEHRARLLETAILPAIMGRDFADPASCFDYLEHRFSRLAIQTGEHGPLSQCVAGVDVALWDLVARRAAKPLHHLFGEGDGRIGAYASGINPTGAASTVDRCRAAGHSAFKLKIGFGRETDSGNVHNILLGLQASETLMLDANQAWELPEAMSISSALVDGRIAWLEEPLRADAEESEWHELANATPVPLAGGENLIGRQAFGRAIDEGYLKVIQPDLCKWGGFSGCIPVARAARAAGRRFCPHYLGGGVGLAASAHFLAAIGGNGVLEIDSNPNPLRDRLFNPEIRRGSLQVSDEPGLGIPASMLFELQTASSINCTYSRQLEA